MVYCCCLLFRCWCVIHVCLAVLYECSCSVVCCAVAAAVGALSLSATDAIGTSTAGGTSTVHSRVAVHTRASLKPGRPSFSNLFRIFCRSVRATRAVSVHDTARAARRHFTQHTALHGTAHQPLTARENEPFSCRGRSAATDEERTLRRLLTCAARAWRLLACTLTLFVESSCSLVVDVVAVVRIRDVFVVFGQNSGFPWFFPLNSKISEHEERSTHQTRHTHSHGSIDVMDSTTNARITTEPTKNSAIERARTAADDLR